MQNAPCVIQVRNNALVQYYDTSVLDIKRNGCKEALKQNNNSVYKDAMKQLNKVTELSEKFSDDINAYYNAYEHFYELHRKKSAQQNIQLKALGTMSKNQLRSCKRAIENMVNMILLNYNKKEDKTKQSFVAFVTLTLPSKQIHTDNEIRKVLIRFIENLKKTHKVNHYIWKAEPQENGNIHFHLLVDKWIDQKAIQKLWNKNINSLGYVDRYMLREKHKGNKNPKQPPSTDIHSLKKVTNTCSYLIKYMTKNEEGKRQIIGKVWGCANITKKLEYPKFRDSERFFDDLINVIEKHYMEHLIKDDYINVYVGKVFEIVSKKFKDTWKAVKEHYNQLITLTDKKIEDIKNTRKVVLSIPKVSGATEFLNEVKEQQRIIRNKLSLEKQKFKDLKELHLYNPKQISLNI